MLAHPLLPGFCVPFERTLRSRTLRQNLSRAAGLPRQAGVCRARAGAGALRAALSGASPAAPSPAGRGGVSARGPGGAGLVPGAVFVPGAGEQRGRAAAVAQHRLGK